MFHSIYNVSFFNHINYIGDHHKHHHNHSNLYYERSPFSCIQVRFILHNHYHHSFHTVVVTITTCSVHCCCVTTTIHPPLLSTIDFLTNYSLDLLGPHIFHHQRHHFFLLSPATCYEKG